MMQIGDTYKHFKGNNYEIIALAKDSETLEDIVVYKALYEPYQTWTRTLQNFEEEVDKPEIPYKGPRFTKC